MWNAIFFICAFLRMPCFCWQGSCSNHCLSILSGGLRIDLTYRANDLSNGAKTNSAKTGRWCVQLIAEAAGARQFLAYLDHIGLDERALNLGEINPALRKSSAPMAIAARFVVDLMEEAAEFLQR